MLIFLRHNLAFLATPKTGSTAVEMALRPKAEVIFAKNRKHVTAQRYQMRVRPFLDQTFGVSPQSFAVMRDPIEQIRSWYRYRHSGETETPEQSAKQMSFDEFVLGVIADNPPPACQIGSQFQFLTSDRGSVLAEHLFAYERQRIFRSFLDEQFKDQINLKPKNVSPSVPTPLSDDVAVALRTARQPEFALYDRLVAADGYLHSPIEQN